jgi:parallel beta-helix repeat protein
MQTRICTVTIVLWLLMVMPATAATISVSSTGTTADITNVQAAIASAQPGDTILLKAGTFDWSGNTQTFSPFLFALGLPVTVSGITITGELGPNGEKLTVIAGRTDTSGLPSTADFVEAPSNFGFVSGPGVTAVTISNITLRNFSLAIYLLQTDSLVSATPLVADPATFQSGADDWIVENVRFENCFQGIQGEGANDRVVVRNSFFRIVRSNQAVPNLFETGGNILGYNAIIFVGGLRFAGPSFLPATDILVQNNTITGPGPEVIVGTRGNGGPLQVNSVAGIWLGVTSRARLEKNEVTAVSHGYRIDLSDGYEINNNVASGSQVGFSLLEETGANRGGTAGSGLLRNNRSNHNILLPIPTVPADAFNLQPTVSGAGFAIQTDNNRLIGNNVQNNEFAGIVLAGDSTTIDRRTAIGNLILGNGNVVAGSQFALSNNTISGSALSVQSVGQVVSQEGSPLRRAGP